MAGRLIEEDLFTKYSIIDSRLPEGQRIHAFLAARAKALAGKYIDFDKTPVTFVLSDSDKPNAFYAPAPDPNPDNKPRRDDYSTVRFIKNPLNTAVICVTRGLIEMASTLDQLDFVLGHELTHMIMRQRGIKNNSKGEETLADLHSVDLMYDAGSDPKQALVISDKISADSDEHTKKRKKKRHDSDREKEQGINWSAIFDIHMTESNRRAGIEAALTKLSHLIDERQPAAIDKSVLEVRYSDPIDAFLKANNYEQKKPFGKLRLLIDCIDHLSAPVPAEEFFQAALAALPKEGSEGLRWQIAHEQKMLKERIDAGYTDYFRGPVVDKRYQQKIAHLAEGILEQARQEREQAESRKKPDEINTKDLNVYLQNRAYQHIAAHGYPKASDLNYREASGILYSYFYALLKNQSPRSQQDENKKQKDVKLPQIKTDIDAARQKIRKAKTAEEFTQAADELERLTHIFLEIRTTSCGYRGDGDKLDNLSSLYNSRDYHDTEREYEHDKLRAAKRFPWDNLVKIAETDAKAKDRIVVFLKRNGVEDFRITHNLPYVRTSRQDCYRVTDDGKIPHHKIQNYELDFAIHRDIILQGYAYIRAYFENEEALIDQKCAEALNISEADYKRVDPENDRRSHAQNKIYDFLSAFNALPPEDQDQEHEHDRYIDRPTALSLIPARHKSEHPLPGSRKHTSGFSESIIFEYDEKLFDFANPIFQEYFGQNFEQMLVARKEAQQQKMFDTAFAILGRAMDTWLEAKPRMHELQEKRSKLWHEIRDSADKAQQKALRAESELVEQEFNIIKVKEDESSSIIYNFLHSIFKGRKEWYHLQRLKPEQKQILAAFAVRDEKSAVLKLFNARGYEFFCDYMNILEEQTARVISVNYKLTPSMQFVADKYGYKHATTKEALKAYTNEHEGKRYSEDNQKYGWYLHMFDIMRYLEQTPEIDVRALAVAFSEIQQVRESSRGGEPAEIISARYLNYKKFMAQSRAVALAVGAIEHQENYKNLSCDELCKTADSLIEMRGVLAGIFGEKPQESRYGEKQNLEITPEQIKFLSVIDENIRGVLRNAEHEALRNPDALGKIEALYRVYNAQREYSYGDSERETYLTEIDRNEERFKKISALSAEASFWPEDVLEHVKAYVFAKNTFLDDKEFENKILNDILDKLETLPAGKKKNECLHTLLDRNLRAAYPETRDRLFAIYTNEVLRKIGKDDGSERYRKKLAAYLKALENETKKDWDIGKQHGQPNGLLSNAMSLADKYLLLRRLSNAIVSQEKTSQMIKEKCQVNLNSGDMVRSYLYGIGVDYLTEEMDRNSEMANRFIQFLNSRGEKKNCQEISSYIESTAKAKCTDPSQQNKLNDILQNTRPSNCKILYENFWSAPLEARAMIIARILKSAVSNPEGAQDCAQLSWEKAFDLVMDNLIHPDDNSTEAKYARSIMHSYIKSRSDYERVLIMSAMMVASRNIENDTGNIGKALRLFLENIGPAENKLGQAIASHPSTPENIAKELQKLKSAANIPARWTLYEWIKAENIPEEFWKGQYLGEILGSGSYYTTVALGDDKVLRILRPEAREKAAKGFRVIGLAVEDLKTKEGTSDLSYQELTSSVQEMIIQAARMAEIETDHNIGQKQYEDEKQMHDGVTIGSDGEIFTLKVMDWRANGQNWIIMDQAKGVPFNALPENTPAQIAYKRAFAKSYVALITKGILSGKKFDHDRHGDQLSIDVKTKEVGIYDTGAMALDDPTPANQRLLGNVMYDIAKTGISAGDGIFSSFSHVISGKIDELHRSGRDTQYLVEVKKGLLALGDFFKILTPENIQDILPSMNLLAEISEDIQGGIAEKMSIFEKAQYRTFLTLQSAQVKDAIVIGHNKGSTRPGINIINIPTTPSVQYKASWLQEAFAKPGETDGSSPEASSFTSFAAPNPGESELHVGMP